MEITEWVPLETFTRDYKKLPPQIKTAVDDCLKRLLKNPKSGKLRFEKLRGIKNPNVYTIHVTGNHNYKLSMEIDGTTAKLRRIATHKEIDRRP